MCYASGEFANGYGAIACDVVAVANCLGSFGAKQKCGDHVINVDGVEQRISAVDDAEETFFDG